MNNKSFSRALIYLLIAGAVGYFLGLGVDALIGKVVNFTAPAAGWLALMLGIVAFFYGLIGYQTITKAFAWQVIGTLSGALFVTLMRWLLPILLPNTLSSMPLVGPFVFTEPAWLFGALVGVLCFISYHGVMDDWFKWARGIDTPEHHDDKPGWEKYFGPSLDHKVIGIHRQAVWRRPFGRRVDGPRSSPPPGQNRTRQSCASCCRCSASAYRRRSNPDRSMS